MKEREQAEERRETKTGAEAGQLVRKKTERFDAMGCRLYCCKRRRGRVVRNAGTLNPDPCTRSWHKCVASKGQLASKPKCVPLSSIL
jgi:hypothetical protein